jgi:hypothetical protein
LAPQDFLDALARTSFGSVILINLYRSTKAGTIPDSSIAEFAADCLSTLAGSPAPKTPVEEADLALASAKEWDSRESASRKYRNPASLSGSGVAQFATVISYKSLIENSAGRSAAHLAFAPRDHGLAGDVEAIVVQWQKWGETWTLGKGRDFFWIAPVLDVSTLNASRLSDGLAQVYRDVLGLSHWGTANTLLRIGIPSGVAESMLVPRRPTAFDGLDNPAFRGACDGEVGAHPLASGFTVDIYKVDTHVPNIDGAREWISAPVVVATGQLFWEYLGVPKLGECLSQTVFHDAMLRGLERTTPISLALPYLKSVV